MAEDDQLGALEDFVRLKLEEADHRPSSAASSMSEAGFPDATSQLAAVFNGYFHAFAEISMKLATEITRLQETIADLRTDL
jgi:hypothetical protein